jgi:uncharacterized protein YjiS (DUF1127 family)
MSNQQNMTLAMSDLSVCSVATPTHAEQRRQFQQLPSRLAGLFNLVAIWKLRHKTRSQLAYATPDVLRDVGISESQRFSEVNKSFWEA